MKTEHELLLKAAEDLRVFSYPKGDDVDTIYNSSVYAAAIDHNELYDLMTDEEIDMVSSDNPTDSDNLVNPTKVTSNILDRSSLQYDGFGTDEDEFNSRYRFKNFNRRNPNEVLTRTTSHAFLVKPSLNLDYKTLTDKTYDVNIVPDTHIASILALNKPFFSMFNVDDIMNKGEERCNSPFIPMLSNHIQSVDLPDMTLSERVSFQGAVRGFTQETGGFIDYTMNEAPVNITFSDNRQREVFNAFDLWVSYIDGVSMGAIRPASKFLEFKVLDYLTTLYQFEVAEDGHTIVGTVRLNSMFPKTINTSKLSFQLTKDLDTINEPSTIAFSCAYMEYNDISIIAGYNSVLLDAYGIPVEKQVVVYDDYIKEVGVAQVMGEIPLIMPGRDDAYHLGYMSLETLKKLTA